MVSGDIRVYFYFPIKTHLKKDLTKIVGLRYLKKLLVFTLFIWDKNKWPTATVHS